MSRLRMLAIFLVTCIAGGMMGWLRPLPAMGSSTDKVEGSDWRLPSPEVLERSSATLSNQARTLRWTGDSISGTSTHGPQDWALKAILDEEGAILLQSGKEALISRAKVGATLPDGSRLLAVRGDTVVVELDDCRMDRHLYPRASDPASPECKTVTPQKDTQQP